LGIEVVAQPILAFEGSFEEANRGKNGIFDRKSWRAQKPSATFFGENVAWEKYTNS
jgi:hypothetical protein